MGYNRVEDEDMQLEDEFGDIIAKARAGNGLSVADLAAAVGLSEPDIREVESYRLIPKSVVTERLAAALGLAPAKLAAIPAGWTPPPVDPSNEAMLVHTVHVPYGAYGENAYILGCVRTRLAAAVDPGGAVDAFNEFLDVGKFTLERILITHAHPDHIGGLRDLAANRPGLIVMGAPRDREAIMEGVSADWRPAEDGSTFSMGELTVTSLCTPGHTPGSTCYAANGACFVGDTLFSGSIGRPASAIVYRQMLDGIRSKVLSLPGQTAILPSHGPATTVAEENAHNPFFSPALFTTAEYHEQ